METTHFLNVDLEIESTAKLTEFSAQFSRHGCAIHETEIDGLWRGAYELHMDSDDPAAVLTGLCAAIESLTGAARETWTYAKRRDFSIGIQGGAQPWTTEWAIEPALLKRISESGARLIICVCATGGKAINGPEGASSPAAD